MNKKVVTVGLLAGGIALTGLAGSAYAEGSGSKPTTPPKKADVPSAVICTGTDGPGTGKVGVKGIVTRRIDGKAPALPKLPGGKPVVTVHAGKAIKVAGGEAVTVVRDKNGHTTVTVGKPPKGLPPKSAVGKGVKCTTVKPGTPGTPGTPPSVPPLPSR